jgi:hypothetical protein
MDADEFIAELQYRASKSLLDKLIESGLPITDMELHNAGVVHYKERLINAGYRRSAKTMVWSKTI